MRQSQWPKQTIMSTEPRGYVESGSTYIWGVKVIFASKGLPGRLFIKTLVERVLTFINQYQLDSRRSTIGIAA